MKTLFAVLSLSLFLVAGDVAAQNRQQLDLARAYEAGGDMRNAARIYVELFETNPRSDEVYQGMVRSMTALNQFNGLLPLVVRRYEASPSTVVAYDAASTCFKLGKFSEAQEWWTKAIERDNGTVYAWAEVARRQASLLDNEHAITSYRTAREKSGTSSAYATQLAALYSVLGRTREAADEILIVHADERELAATYGRLSALMTSDTAEVIVLQSIDSHGDVPDLPFIKQWYYRHTSQWKRALEITEEIDKESKSPGTEMLRFADAARAEGAYDIAIDAYGRLIGKNAHKGIALSAAYGYALTLDYQLRSQPRINQTVAADAVERYRSIIVNYPDHPLCADALFHAAVLLDEVLGKTDEARDMLTRLTNRWRGTTSAVDGALALSNLYLAAGQEDAAIRVLNTVVEDKQANMADRRETARLRIADLLLFRGSKDSAQAVYKKLSESPGSVAANDALDRIGLLMLEQFDAKGVQGYIQGMSALSRRNKIEASRIFVATAQSASDSEIKDRCRISAARTLIEIGEEAAADSQLIAIIDRIPESTYGDQALVLAADVLERRKDIQGAISALTSLLVQYPRSILAPSARERIRRLRGDA